MKFKKVNKDLVTNGKSGTKRDNENNSDENDPVHDMNFFAGSGGKGIWGEDKANKTIQAKKKSKLPDNMSL